MQALLAFEGQRGPVGLCTCLNSEGWGFKSCHRQFSFWPKSLPWSQSRRKRDHSLSHRIGAEAVGEEEKMRKTEASFEASILGVWGHLTIFSVLAGFSTWCQERTSFCIDSSWSFKSSLLWPIVSILTLFVTKGGNSILTLMYFVLIKTTFAFRKKRLKFFLVKTLHCIFLQWLSWFLCVLPFSNRYGAFP